MALAEMLEKGYRADHIHTVARVHIAKTGEGFRITGIELDMEGKVPGSKTRHFCNWRKKPR